MLSVCMTVGAQPRSAEPETTRTVKLADVRIRDPFILADTATMTYYLIASARNGVRAFTSKDLETWEGPFIIYSVPEDGWGQAGIWAPELHAYRGKYYLFATMNTRDRFPEQWRNWPPRLKRGTQVLAADSPLGPFRAFQNRAHTPEDMMTLDGTLWVEDGAPYMV
jgi:beta-xylosidase